MRRAQRQRLSPAGAQAQVRRSSNSGAQREQSCSARRRKAGSPAPSRRRGGREQSRKPASEAKGRRRSARFGALSEAGGNGRGAIRGRMQPGKYAVVPRKVRLNAASVFCLRIEDRSCGQPAAVRLSLLQRRAAEGKWTDGVQCASAALRLYAIAVAARSAKCNGVGDARPARDVRLPVETTCQQGGARGWRAPP
jgi:hypothetical protein